MTRAMTPKAAQRRRSRFMERRASAASPGERMAAAVDYLRAVLAAAGRSDSRTAQLADAAADYLAAVAHDEDKRRQLL
jgi:hypothetical protein